MGFLVQRRSVRARCPSDRAVRRRAGAGALVGFLAVAPIYARDGWLLQDLLRDPDAPNGTAELLVDAAMRAAPARGQPLVTLGLAPLAGDVPAPLRLARRAGRGALRLRGPARVQGQAAPGALGSDLSRRFPHDIGPARAVVDVLAAFARGGLLRFGLATLLRGPALVVRAARGAARAVDGAARLRRSARLVPAPAVKWGWVASTCCSPSRSSRCAALAAGLARVLAAAIAADAVVTALEAIWWNVPRATDGAARSLLMLAALAPIVAVAVLSAAVRRRRG